MIIESPIHPEICKYYAPTEYNLDALYNEYFWFSKRENLNDPFDLAGFAIKKRDNIEFLDYYRDKFGLANFDIFKEYALCSFTKSYRNRLMWAYYSCNYTGWCLTFRTSNILMNDNANLQTVIYIDDNSMSKDIIRNQEDLLLIKHYDWKHEQEERILIKRQDNNFKRRWAKGILGSIIIGHNINESYRSLIKTYCENNNVSLYTTKIGYDFNILIEQII